jgi:hypothetical protein
MNYFEYTFSGDLTPKFEEKTQFLLTKINEGYVPFKLDKYYDEDISADKKKRTLIIVSPINATDYLYSTMRECNLAMVAYFKQRIV